MATGSKRPRKKWSVVRIVLIYFNAMTTFVTLFTGLREDLVVSSLVGRYNGIRMRFRSGSINTHIMEYDQYYAESLATPQELADYTFIMAPTRNTWTFGEDVSVCSHVNTDLAPVMLSNYDDFWGKTSRRLQIYVYSISAPKCEILNVRPEWYRQCVAARQGNATRCFESILTDFETLAKDHTVRQLVENDLGAAGNLFLRCYARPLKPFAYVSDRLAHQAYWEGEEFHVTLQTSSCHATPLVRSDDHKFTLFEAYDDSDSATMLVLLPPDGWVALAVMWTHSIVKIALVLNGIKAALFHTQSADYLPNTIRSPSDRPWMRYALPFMDMAASVSRNARAIITFKGSLVVLSDVWVSHWLLMWLSMLDAILNIRETYVTYEIASSLLIVRVTFESLMYLCMALTKITWIMCLVQTILRMVLRLVVRCLRSVRLIKSKTREHIEWTIDSISIFLSYRVYYMLLFLIALVLIFAKGDPSFMERATPYKMGAYGGPVKIASFWGSEVACDLVTLLGLLAIVGQALGMAMLCTPYRHVANNSLMRLLQKRYMISGWDGLMAAHTLGLDPYEEDVVVDEVAYTRVSIGSLLQLLYLSGPSGFVHLGGDYIFHDNGFSKEPVRFSYPIPKAMEMGLFDSGKGSQFSSSHPTTTADRTTGHKYANSSPSVMPTQAKQPAAALLTAKKSIFERKLRLVGDGYMGKLLFVDANQAGQIKVNNETGQREYEVIDALTTMSILDIKYLMGNDKKIHAQ